MSVLRFFINRSEENDILAHLLEMDELFVPALHTYVNIKEYAHKLFTKAVRFEIWNGEGLKGLVAGYLVKQGNKYYISNYSVSRDLKGLNAAFDLLERVDQYCMENDIYFLQLEVRKENAAAIFFYKRNGFKQVDEGDETIIMERSVNLETIK